MNARPHKNSPHSPLGAFRDQSASETISAPVGAKIGRPCNAKVTDRDGYAALSHLTYVEAGKVLGCSPYTVRYHAAQFKLPYPERLKTLENIARAARNRQARLEATLRAERLEASNAEIRQIPFTAIGASGRERTTHVSLPREPWL